MLELAASEGCKLQHFNLFLSMWCHIPQTLTHYKHCYETFKSEVEASCYHNFLNDLLQVVDATRVLAERRNVGKVLLRVDATSRE
jgi:hypothetical protein